MAGDDAVVALALRSPSGSHARGRRARVRRARRGDARPKSGGSLSRRPTSSRRSTSNEAASRSSRLSSSCAAMEPAMRAARGAEPRSMPLWPSQLAKDQLWLSSHQGGHRFAANVLVLPLGVHLGRVAPEGRGTDRRPCAVGEDRPSPLPRPVRLRGARPGRGAGGADSPRTRRGRRISSSSTRTARSSASGTTPAGSTSRVVEESVGPTVPASCGADPEPQAGFVARVV